MEVKKDYKYHYVYKITNLIDNKAYIGRRSVNKLPEKDNYFGSGGLHFQNALKKHGKENFKKEIVAIYPDFKTLCDYEVYWIDFLGTYKDGVGYNKIRVSEGWGVGELNPVFGKPENNPMFGRKGKDNPNTGLKRSKEFCELMRVLHTGKIVSEETRRKNSIAASKRTGEKNSFYGKTHSKETIEENRQAQLNQPIKICLHCGLESRSAANMKRYHFDNCIKNPKYNKEDIIKIKEERKVLVHSEEAKRKIGETQKAKPDVICPWCGKVGRESGMKARHFDYCIDNPNSKRKKQVKPKKVECPYCNKIGGSNIMHLHHFDNCELKPKYKTKAA